MYNGTGKKYLTVNTGNLVIDTFISAFHEKARIHGIEFNTDIYVNSSDIPVEAYDLCIVLGNLLDNSMKACIQNINDDRKIYIKIVTGEEHFVIVIRNTYNHNKKDNSDLEHGYGIKNINAVVHKYCGLMDVEEGEWYCVNIIFPVK